MSEKEKNGGDPGPAAVSSGEDGAPRRARRKPAGGAKSPAGRAGGTGKAGKSPRAKSTGPASRGARTSGVGARAKRTGPASPGARAPGAGARAKRTREAVPVQGYEADGERATGPVQPPGGIEILATAGEVVNELAKAGVSRGERVLRDLIGRLPL